ncbi:hypothetical protein P9112_014264 [Eukaryota sp. TZLM1-RC]
MPSTESPSRIAETLSREDAAHVADDETLVFSYTNLGPSLFSTDQLSLKSQDHSLLITTAFLDHCQILSISSLLPTFHNLTELHLDFNQLSTIDGCLPFFKRVEYLSLTGNRISSIQNINHFRHLRVLKLSDNELSSLPCFSGQVTRTLETLLLSYNYLNELSSTVSLSSLSNLKILDVQGNPFMDSNKVTFEQFCLSSFSKLRMLNGRSRATVQEEIVNPAEVFELSSPFMKKGSSKTLRIEKHDELTDETVEQQQQANESEEKAQNDHVIAQNDDVSDEEGERIWNSMNRREKLELLDEFLKEQGIKDPELTRQAIKSFIGEGQISDDLIDELTESLLSPNDVHHPSSPPIPEPLPLQLDEEKQEAGVEEGEVSEEEVQDSKIVEQEEEEDVCKEEDQNDEETSRHQSNQSESDDSYFEESVGDDESQSQSNQSFSDDSDAIIKEIENEIDNFSETTNLEDLLSDSDDLDMDPSVMNEAVISHGSPEAQKDDVAGQKDDLIDQKDDVAGQDDDVMSEIEQLAQSIMTKEDFVNVNNNGDDVIGQNDHVSNDVTGDDHRESLQGSMTENLEMNNIFDTLSHISDTHDDTKSSYSENFSESEEITDLEALLSDSDDDFGNVTIPDADRVQRLVSTAQTLFNLTQNQKKSQENQSKSQEAEFSPASQLLTKPTEMEKVLEQEINDGNRANTKKESPTSSALEIIKKIRESKKNSSNFQSTALYDPYVSGDLHSSSDTRQNHDVSSRLAKIRQLQQQVSENFRNRYRVSLKTP